MTIRIAGAGMAGLLAANLLSRRNPIVLEVQPNLPNGHSAVLRFRSSIVGDVLGIPFKQVSMVKAVAGWKNPVADALAYSFKNTGVLRSDRSITAGTVVGERYIAPLDLVHQMARLLRSKPQFSTPCDFSLKGDCVSTIPMKSLMQALNYPHRDAAKFAWQPAVNIRVPLANTDAYVSLLVPDPQYPFSRISITGDELIIEIPGGALETYTSAPGTVSFTVNRALELLGLSLTDQAEFASVHASPYAKILPIDEDIRKDFIHWATEHHGVWSVGRFACWKPGLLLDSLVEDIQRIDGWLTKRSRYDIQKAR